MLSFELAQCFCHMEFRKHKTTQVVFVLKAKRHIYTVTQVYIMYMYTVGHI